MLVISYFNSRTTITENNKCWNLFCIKYSILRVLKLLKRRKEVCRCKMLFYFSQQDEGHQSPVTVNIENLCVTSYGGIDDEQLNSLESWLAVYLSFTDVTIEDGVPKAELQEGQDALHAHADQVKKSFWQ